MFKTRDAVFERSESCIQTDIGLGSIPAVLKGKLLFRRDLILQSCALQRCIYNKRRPVFWRRHFQTECPTPPVRCDTQVCKKRFTQLNKKGSSE